MSDERARSDEVMLEVPRPHPDSGRPPRLLAIRPFLWLVLGEGLANVGLWAFFVAAEGEAVFRFRASPGQLGILMSSYSITFIAGSPAFGYLADRWSPKRLLVLAQASATVFLLVASVAPSLPWLYGATALFGVAQAMVWPARGALVPLLVDEDRLVQANGMMGVAWQIPLVIGPLLAGLVAGTFGSDGPYYVAMAAVALSLPLYALIPDRRTEAGETRERFLADLVGGFREAWKTRVLRSLILQATGAYLLLGMVITLEILYVKDVLHRGLDFLGLLWSVTGVGAALGSLSLAGLRHGVGRERLLVALGLVGGGAGYLAYIGTSSPAVSLVGGFVFGAGFTFFSSPAQALIQRVAARPGKVTAVYAMLSESGPLAAALGVAALGGLVVVQPWLIWSGALFTGLGLASLAGARRGAAGRREAGARREPGP